MQWHTVKTEQNAHHPALGCFRFDSELVVLLVTHVERCEVGAVSTSGAKRRQHETQDQRCCVNTAELWYRYVCSTADMQRGKLTNLNLTDVAVVV